LRLSIDSPAGERERGSLEPLLANPVATGRLVVGKWLAAWTFASAVAVLTLSGFVTASLLYAQKKLSTLMALGAPELVQFVAMLVPFGAMTAALQMLICTYGRTYREAQTYVSYFFTLASFVPLVVMFSGLKEAGWQLAVPVLAQQMVMSRVVRGDAISAWDYALPAGISFAVAALCLVAIARLLRDERIVFGRS
jgi:sodium transport system permease protein